MTNTLHNVNKFGLRQKFNFSFKKMTPKKASYVEKMSDEMKFFLENKFSKIFKVEKKDQ